jgi:hypothetical protein
MADIRSNRVVRLLVPTPAGTDSQTYADVKLVAGSNITLSTVVSSTNRATVTIAASGGGGGSSDHATLSNLAWTASAHTGTASRVAGFNGSGAATYYAIDSVGGLQGYSTTLAAVVAGTYSGSSSITTLGTISAGTWSGSTIAVDKGGTGLSSYTAGDMLYATGATTLATTTSTATGRSILALGAPPTGYVLGNAGSGLAWIAATVYITQVRIPDIAVVVNHSTNPGLIIQSTGTIGGP